MTSLRLYNLYRRAGNGPCEAFRLAQATQPDLMSVGLYLLAAVIAVAAAVLSVAG